MATTRYGTVGGRGRDGNDKWRIYDFTPYGQKKKVSPWAAANDIVVSIANGDRYKCSKSGWYGTTKGDLAQFTLEANKEPIHAPNTITSLSVARDGLKYTAKWTNPKTFADQKSPLHVTKILTSWNAVGNVWAGSTLAANATTDTYTINRALYYPVTATKRSEIKFNVRGANLSGDYGKGTASLASKSYAFKVPRQPTIDAFKFDTATGVVSTHIKTNEGKDAQERYDTRYSMYVYNAAGKQVAKVVDTSSTSTDITVSWNASGYQSLGYNDYYRVVVKAWARGLAGDSKPAEKTYYVSYPGRVTVKSMNISSKTDDGKCTLLITTNDVDQHPVDKVELEYLADCTYAKESDIPGTAEWTKSGIVDDGTCSALAISTQNLIPSAGKYTWVRVKSWHANENILYRYSKLLRVRDLETPAPTAADEEIKILGCEAVDDTSVLVTLGWNKNGQDDSTGTEISWSESENTWKSTEDPNTYTFTWSDGQLVHEGTTYRDSAKITVKNLDEGLPVYIKARRYMETDESTTWSDYSNTYMYIPYAEADNVVAVADQYVATGKSLEVSWTFGSYAYQTAWQIVRTGGLVIASGEGINTAYQISAERLAAVAVNNTFDFTVQVSTGSGFISSDTHTVTIVDPPTIEVDASNITAQPYSFDVTCSTDATLLVTVTSQGVSGTPELNIGNQPEGDTVYSALITPEWTLTNNENTATIDLPVVDFRNNGIYTISVVAQDTTTGLEGNTSADVTVDWAHVAPTPVCELTAIDDYDEEGNHILAVQFDLSAPEDAEETDVYDIYRLSGGVVTRIVEGAALSSSWVDNYAPYGNDVSWYRVAVRTADGDAGFLDFDYSLSFNAMRFEWQGNTLELPYNLAITDSYTKDVETRQHLDGSTDAYWNSAVMRSAGLSSDVIRLTQQADIDLTRQLGRYPGAVFVRTPDGSAYEADVQVKDMSTTGMVEAIAIDAVEVSTTGQFIAEEIEEEEE